MPRDCTEPRKVEINEQSRSHAVSHTMAGNKNEKSTKAMTQKKSKKSQKSKAQRQVVRNYTPFADVGGSLGGMFGPIGKAAGRWLGSGVGAIFGSGDYQVSGSTDYNVLTRPSQIPQFATNKQANIICHREYLGDVYGSTGFAVNQYPINPGSGITFPWLSAIATNFEQYKLHGLVFEFKSTSTDSASNPALGTVIMATQYDPYDPSFSSKMTMENYEYAVSTKPSQSMLHGVECAVGQSPLQNLYVQGAVPNGLDQRFSNMGVFSIATQGMPSVYQVGELWCSFAIELLKPKIPATIGGTQSCWKYWSKVTAAAVAFGAGAAGSSTAAGSLAVRVDPSITMLYMNLIPNNYYSITVVWSCATVGAWALGGVQVAGATPAALMSNGTATNTNFGNWASPSSSGVMALQYYFKATATTSTFSVSGFSAPSVANLSVDILVSAVDNSALPSGY